MFGKFDVSTGTSDGSGTRITGDNVAFTTIESVYDDWLTLVATANRHRATVDEPALNGIVDALVGQGLDAAAEDFAWERDNVTYLATSVGIDRNDWLFNAEYIHVNADHAFLSTRQSWYAALGHRFGAWTPMLTYGESRPRPQKACPGQHSCRQPVLRCRGRSC